VQKQRRDREVVAELLEPGGEFGKAGDRGRKLAKNPTSARRPSMNEYPGSSAAFRATARPLLALRIPVIECG
jgi:hypothetical protein